ncbi:MAG: cell division protein ZapA [Flavobacteriales bacterium]|nr:cell division protein ZapA [Flavobacteriales bacterium]
MEEKSIRVEIAGRAYPLTISVGEEEHVRQAAAQIDESMARMREHYPLTDRQDLLAMSALEVCVRALNSSGSMEQEAVGKALSRLESMLSDVTRERSEAELT